MSTTYQFTFVVRLTGYGSTPEAAWEQCEEAVTDNGLGDCPPELTSTYNIHQANRKGIDYAIREAVESGVPNGCLAVLSERLCKNHSKS